MIGLPRDPSSRRFEPGELAISPAATRVATEDGLSIDTLVNRHAAGDEGRVTRELSERNAVAIRTRGWFVSAFTTRAHETIVIATDLSAHRTVVELESAWLARERAREQAIIAEDARVLALTERAHALEAELQQVQAALPVHELDASRQAEADAGAELDRLVVAEATGDATASDVRAAEAAYAQAQSRRAVQERKLGALSERIRELETELADATGARRQAEAAALQREARNVVDLAPLIGSRDQAARRAREVFGELRDILIAIKAGEEPLHALGAVPNPNFGRGFGTTLESIVCGEQPSTGIDTDPWLPAAAEE